MIKRIFILSYDEAVRFNPVNYGKTIIVRISIEKFKLLEHKEKILK